MAHTEITTILYQNLIGRKTQSSVFGQTYIFEDTHPSVPSCQLRYVSAGMYVTQNQYHLG